jgi:hypothetical protein
MFAPSALLALAVCGAGETVLVDFRADWCGPCRQMDPVVARLAAAGWPVKQVDIDAHPDLVARYRVQAIPCFVLLVDGREAGRLEGICTEKELLTMFQRAGLGRQGAGQGRGGGTRPFRASAGGGTQALPDGTFSRSQSPDDDQPAAAASGESSPPDNPHRPTRARPPRRLIERLLAATVRLRIDDGDGRSVGTGTIIDARAGEALVLTCGHLFRSSGGRGGIRIDTFGPGAARNLRGRLLSYNLERDLALVAFRTPASVATARLAPVDYQLRVGDAVVNIGCDHGAEPTAIKSEITSIDKFVGPPNVQVAGQPVQGRSGGGLFTADGLVIGVCNAADPADDEGLYAALRSIHAQLEEAGLLAMIVGDASTAGPPPALPPRMPQAASPTRDAVVPTSEEKQPPAVPVAAHTGQRQTEDGETAELSPEEAALLEELGRRAGTAEVICIVRSSEGGKSEIFVLQQASPAFFRRLAAAGNR